MRFKNSLRNSAVAFIGQILNIFLGFGVRTVFIHCLSKEFLGVNGIMESMITLLSVTELGIGTSIAFALYSPVNNNDERRIGTLMNFYRKTYHALGIFTLVVGLALVPFMRFFAKDATGVEHLNVIYLLFLANTVLSYFFAYKRTLLSAYQENYVNSLSEDIFAVIKYILQAIVLICFKSYIGYLIIHLVCTFFANLVISNVCNKKHGFIKNYKNEKLDNEDKSLLKTSVVSLMYQKVGAKLVTGTDNLMISYVNIALMGEYSNYSMVISTISRVVYNVMHSLMGSIGNLMVQKDNEHKYKVYEEFVFTTFCFFYFVSTVLSGCMERFIAFWAGEDWVLSPLVTFVVIMNFFLQGMRQPNVIIIEAAGLFNKMRAKAVWEVIVNLIVSFIFLIVFDMGIYGVLLGTTVSMVSVCIWWEAGAVHKHSFQTSQVKYWGRYIKNIIIAAIGCFVSYKLCKYIPYNGFGGLVLSGIVSAMISIGLIALCYFKSRELKGMIRRFVKR